MITTLLSVTTPSATPRRSFRGSHGVVSAKNSHGDEAAGQSAADTRTDDGKSHDFSLTFLCRELVKNGTTSPYQHDRIDTRGH